MKIKIGLILLFLISCSPAPEKSAPSSIVIKTPKSDRSKRSTQSKRKLQNITASVFRGSDLTILDDIDCYVVAVGRKGSGTCLGDEKYSNLEVVSATVADGGEIFIDELPTLENLMFYVIGFSIGNAAQCPDFRNINEDQLSYMGSPYVVGSKGQSLEAVEENIVNITIQMSGAKALKTCAAGPFNWNMGGFFGTARFGRSKFAP